MADAYPLQRPAGWPRPPVAVAHWEVTMHAEPNVTALAAHLRTEAERIAKGDAEARSTYRRIIGRDAPSWEPRVAPPAPAMLILAADLLERAHVGVCSGCGSSQTLADIQLLGARSCCPERKMLSAKEWEQRATAAEAKGARLLEALFMCATHCQGGHSAAGDATAAVLGIPFPLNMENLERAAVDAGLDPAQLWPWYRRRRRDAVDASEGEAA